MSSPLPTLGTLQLFVLLHQLRRPVPCYTRRREHPPTQRVREEAATVVVSAGKRGVDQDGVWSERLQVRQVVAAAL